MQRARAVAVLLAWVAGFSMGCGKQQPAVDRTGENIVAKTFFQDASWYFESSRFRTPYVAVKVRPNLELNLEEEQVGFQLLRRLVDLQEELAMLPQGDPAREGKERELQQGESFLEYLIELQTAYGISNFF